VTHEVPTGWRRVSLREITLPAANISPGDFPDQTFTYIDVSSIDNISNRVAETKTVLGRRAPSRARQAIRKNDILFSTVRTNLRNIALVEEEYSNPVGSTAFAVIRPATGVSPEFVFYQVLSDDFIQPVTDLQSGSNYPAVRESQVFDQPFLLPPEDEQIRIVRRLQELFAKISAGESAARRAESRLLKYRAALLHAAFTGALTSDWRGARETHEASAAGGRARVTTLMEHRRRRWEAREAVRVANSSRAASNDDWKARYPEPAPPGEEPVETIPESWAWASADQITEGTRPITYGVVKLGADVAGGIPVLRSSDVRLLRIDTTAVKHVAKAIADPYARTALSGGEVLLTIRGTLGGVAPVSPELAGFNISREVAMLALVDRDMAALVAFFIASPALQEWLNARSKGVAYTGINIETLRELPIPVPPEAEQREIVTRLHRRWNAADDLGVRLAQQLQRAPQLRQALLRDARSGTLVPPGPAQNSADLLLARMALEKAAAAQAATKPRASPTKRKLPSMKRTTPTSEDLIAAWHGVGKDTSDARQLFDALGLDAERISVFYELLNRTPEVRDAFLAARPEQPRASPPPARSKAPAAPGAPVEEPTRFRLLYLWIKEFKNLNDYKITFQPDFSIDVVLGWNGTGKSNLFEALVLIFRDLAEWVEKNRWDRPMEAYRLRYEIDGNLVEIDWAPDESKRPRVTMTAAGEPHSDALEPRKLKREEIPLPRFVFAYYSGPTNRLADIFLPMKQAHYGRLRSAETDDAATLARLLDQRRFFCAETHHAKYVLLAFSYKEDPAISAFLKKRLRILGFGSALFVIRKPNWAKKGGGPDDFWGATGIMRRVAERLRRFAAAPMVLQQRVSYGYRKAEEDHYYFFLPDLASLRAFAAEYNDARSFFLALESTDFSELIHDLQIQVKVQATAATDVPITFRQLSEGEQQLLMVLGLLRFTKSNQSLVLLDEPDTHLNPHWSVDYLQDVSAVMSDNATGAVEQQTSQILMATHDPLVVASLLKEQIHLLKRDPKTLHCYWEQPLQDAKGLGFTGILTSEMFGFRSDLDEETTLLLDRQAQLAAKDPLDAKETQELVEVTTRIERLGFKSSSSDPYYRAFIQALMRRGSARALLTNSAMTRTDIETLRTETSEILRELDTEDDSHL